MTSDPKPGNPQSVLADLQMALHRLQSYSLPAHAHLAIQNCLQQAEETAAVIGAGFQDNRKTALYEACLSLNEELDLNQTLTKIMDKAILISSAERGYLVLSGFEELGSIVPEIGMDMRIARSYIKGDLDAKDRQMSHTVIRNVMEKGKGIVTTDAQSDSRFAGKDSFIIHGPSSILCCPIKYQKQNLGVIYVENRSRTSQFSDEDLKMMAIFAAQAGVAIHNASLYTQTNNVLSARNNELDVLTQFEQDLNTCTDLEQAIEATRRWSLQVTGGSRAWIALLQANGKTMEMFSGPLGEAHAIAEDDPVLFLIDQAIGEKEPRIFHSDGIHPERLLASLTYAGKALGVLGVERSGWTPGSYPEAAITSLHRLVVCAAFPIANARLLQNLRNANSSKSKFVSTVSHELRLPMTSIKGYADLIKAGAVGPVNDQQKSFLNIIRTNVDRMSNLVSNLSDMSKLETGRLLLTLDFVPAMQLVKDTVQTIQPRFDEKQQSVEFSLPENLPAVYADANRVTQVLTNLLNNANKYTPPEGKISIRAEEQGKKIRFEVADTGIGIKSEDQDKLFTQFFRSDDQRVRDEPGWGLSLFVSKSLVETMGGQMGAQSESEKGSLFWFTLPVEKSMPLGIEDEE